MRDYKYLKEYKTAVKREVAIRYAKARADKLKPLISDPTIVQNCGCFSLVMIYQQYLSIVINHIIILHFTVFILLQFALLFCLYLSDIHFSWALHTPVYAFFYALHGIPLHMYLLVHGITCPHIGTFLCIALHSYARLHALHDPTYYQFLILVVSRGFGNQAYKLQIFPSKQLLESHSFLKANTVFLIGGLTGIVLLSLSVSSISPGLLSSFHKFSC